MHRFNRASFLIALLVAACDDLPTTPNGSAPVPSAAKSSANPLFVQYSDDVAGLVPVDTGFWAVRGEKRELRLSFRQSSGPGSGEEFLRFTVEDKSLLRYPDGRLVQDGDSVFISVHVDPATYAFRFEPSGLKFSTSDPAELRIRYFHHDADVNHDGHVDGTDATLELRLRIWQQELTTDPWFALASHNKHSDDEIEADVRGFTGFALAAN